MIYYSKRLQLDDCDEFTSADVEQIYEMVCETLGLDANTNEGVEPMLLALNRAFPEPLLPGESKGVPMEENEPSLEVLNGFIKDTEKMCRKFEELKEWDSLTQAERLKKGLTEYMEQGSKP